MRIHAVAMNLARGGSERVLLSICEEMLTRGHQVIIFTRRVSQKAEYPLPAGLERRVLISGSRTRSLLRGLPAPGFIRRYWEMRHRLLSDNPDVLLAFGVQMAVRVLFYTLGNRTPVIVSERNNPDAKSVSGAFRLLRRLLYRRAAAVVLVSNDMKRFFSWLPENTLTMIHNAAPVIQCSPAAGRDRSGPLRIVAMGRLVPQKGFDLLLSAFAAVHFRSPDIQLTILGEGPERPALEGQISALNLSLEVRLCGIVENPSEILCRSDVFVLSSRFEGFPNVLLEALACDLPIVSFDCPTGPREIVISGKNGILVPAEDTAGLADAITDLCIDSELRRRLAQNARSSLDRFDNAAIMNKWEQLLQNVKEKL